MPDRSMDTIPSSLVRDRIGNRLHVRVLYSIYARGVWINRFIILEVLRNMALPLLFSHTEMESTVAIASAPLVVFTLGLQCRIVW